MKYLNVDRVKKVSSWAPTLLGAAVGVAGGAYVIDSVRNWVKSYAADDVYDWITRIVLTALGILVWVSIPTAVKGNKAIADGISGAALGFSVVGTIGIVQKLLNVPPTAIGSLRPAPLAARPVIVTRKESTPAYGNPVSTSKAVALTPTPAF